jgi:hypothetical protein
MSASALEIQSTAYENGVPGIFYLFFLSSLSHPEIIAISRKNMVHPCSHIFEPHVIAFDLGSGNSSLLAEPADESFCERARVSDGADRADVDALLCAACFSSGELCSLSCISFFARNASSRFCEYICGRALGVS